MIRIFAVFLLLIVADSGLCQPSAYFKPNIEEWYIEAQPEVYAGDDLFFLIDGGADLYLEYGFKEVAVANYGFSNQLLHVEVYEMTNSERAWGVYSARRPYAVSAGSNQYLAFGNGYAMAVRGKNYIVVSDQNGTAKTEDFMQFTHSFIAHDVDCQQFTINHDLLLKYDQNQMGVLFFGRAGFSSVYSFGSSNFQNFRKGIAQKSGSQQLAVELIYESSEHALTDFNQFRMIAFGSDRYTKKEENDLRVLLHDRDKTAITLKRIDQSIFISINPL